MSHECVLTLYILNLCSNSENISHKSLRQSEEQRLKAPYVKVIVEVKGQSTEFLSTP